MKDFFGRMVASVLLIMAIVFLPVLTLSLKMENTTRSMIETYVTEFVDNARGTGKITPEEYEKCYSNILRCQEFCSFEITHSSKMFAADEDANGFYSDFNTQDILDVMYNGAEETAYEMRNGDYLKVTVKNEKPTMATRLYRIFIRLNKNNNTSIYVNYGGLVGNYIEEDK